MKIPSKVKIGGSTYDIVLTNKPLIIGDKANHAGVIHYQESLIEIDSAMSVDSMIQTILHEIMHGISIDRGIDLGNKEEVIIENLSRGLHALIIDNPNLFKGE